MGTYKVEKKTWAQGMEMVQRFKILLEEVLGVKQVFYGGSLRRGKAEIGDIDLVVVEQEPDLGLYSKFLTALTDRGYKVEIRTKGDSQMSVLVDDFLVEIKRAKIENLGAMMLFVTGSGEFNVGLRAYVKSRGYSLNQYGLFKDEKLIASKTEEEIFGALGLAYVEPRSRTEFRLEKKGIAKGSVLAICESSSGNGTYEIRKSREGSIYCTCPGWRYRKHCKHLERWSLIH